MRVVQATSARMLAHAFPAGWAAAQGHSDGKAASTLHHGRGVIQAATATAGVAPVLERSGSAGQVWMF